MGVRDNTLAATKQTIKSLVSQLVTLESISNIDVKRKDNYDHLMELVGDESRTIREYLKNLELSISLFENGDTNKVKEMSNSDYNKTDYWKERSGRLKVLHNHTCQGCGRKANDIVSDPDWEDRDWITRIETHHSDWREGDSSWKSPNVGFERSSSILVLCSKCHRAMHNTKWPDLEKDSFVMRRADGSKKKYTHTEYQSKANKRRRR